MWMRFFWVRKIRKKKVWEKKRKKQAGEFLCCNKTTEPLPKIQAFAPPRPQFKLLGCCCWLWVVVFVVWDFWQFVLVCGLFCMCNLRFPKGVIFIFYFASHKAKSSWEEVEEEEEEEEED
jgi:hypothetical protein